MKYLVLVVMILSLIGCMDKTAGDKIVLKVYRGGILNALNPQSTYVISVDGSGETGAKLPPDLEDDPEWSPDGQWVAFDTWLRDDARAGGNADIYIMNADGSRRVRVTSSTGDDMAPTWSPDGTRIAYAASGTVSTLDVECILRGQTCTPQPIALVRGNSPHWSPNGKQIVYQSRRPGGGISVISIDDGGQPIDLTPTIEYCNHPRWSPDGKKVAFNCPGNVYVINADGSGLTNLTDGKYGGNPKWSPDGHRIAFVSSREGGNALNPEGSMRSDSIYLMDPDGQNVMRLTKHDDESVIWYAWLPAMRAVTKP